MFSKELFRVLNVSFIILCIEEEIYELMKGLCLLINGLIDVILIGFYG